MSSFLLVKEANFGGQINYLCKTDVTSNFDLSASLVFICVREIFSLNFKLFFLRSFFFLLSQKKEEK